MTLTSTMYKKHYYSYRRTPGINESEQDATVQEESMTRENDVNAKIENSVCPLCDNVVQDTEDAVLCEGQCFTCLEAKLESVVEENERLNKAHEELHQLISEKDRQLQKEISLRKKEQEMYVDYDNEQSLTIFKLEENIDALKLEISKKKSEYVENDPVKCSVQSQCEIIKQSSNDISDGLFSCGFNALKRTIERLDLRVRDLEEKSISATMKTCVAPVPEKLVEFTPSLVSSLDQTCWKPQSTPPVGAQPLKPDETIEEFFEANIQKYRVCNPANRTNRSLSPGNPTVDADEDGSPTQNPNPHFLCNTSTAKARWKIPQRSRLFINSKLKLSKV
ncbi:hypothetical protein J6590_094541 [Homalodisca vitripennis]|nr:hypothetical protein J6590_094541 [Homalodisca vitripennis]